MQPPILHNKFGLPCQTGCEDPVTAASARAAHCAGAQPRRACAGASRLPSSSAKGEGLRPRWVETAAVTQVSRDSQAMRERACRCVSQHRPAIVVRCMARASRVDGCGAGRKRVPNRTALHGEVTARSGTSNVGRGSRPLLRRPPRQALHALPGPLGGHKPEGRRRDHTPRPVALGDVWAQCLGTTSVASVCRKAEPHPSNCVRHSALTAAIGSMEVACGSSSAALGVSRAVADGLALPSSRVESIIWCCLSAQFPCCRRGRRFKSKCRG